LPRRLLRTALVRHDRSILPAGLTTQPVGTFHLTKTIPWRGGSILAWVCSTD
jgi:hypothetical protein